MKIQELRQFARDSLHGNYKLAWGMALLYPVLWIVMEAVPDILAGMLWHANIMTSSELLFGKDWLWVLFAVLWEMLRFCIIIPVFCSACSWFSHLLGFGRKRMHVFRDRYFFWHSMRFFGMIEIMKFFVIFPLMLSGMVTVYAFQKSILQEDAGLWLFAVIQGIAVSIWIIIFYIKFCVSLLATPLLFLEKPDCPVFRTVGLSRKLLDGQYGKIFLILFSGLCLPNQVTMLLLFLQIRVREYLQEQEFAQEGFHAGFIILDEQDRALYS